MTIFPNFTKNSIFGHKRISPLSFIWYQKTKSAKKHLLQHFMIYYAQSCQKKTSIVPNWHSTLHTKLLLLLSGHSSIVLYLFNFLRLRGTRTTTLIGNGNKTPQVVFRTTLYKHIQYWGPWEGDFCHFSIFSIFF